MTVRCWQLSAVACLSLISLATVAAPPDQTLAIRASADSYQLAVPVSRLVMTIPRGNFVAVEKARSGAGASPRYFHLADSSRGIMVSGWFEAADSYPGFESFWKAETSSWAEHHLPPPRNPSIVKVAGWDAAIYEVEVPIGNNTHIRSEWAQLGTWIDLHISVTTAAPPEAARATALDLLRSIRITEAP